MIPTTQPRIEPLPGYVAIERIGAGGYGEVWKATAPGGVEKAVKTLHGYHNEELAARELKALERIKDVRHPFLLSLDRFEIHAGRLVVVMELADMSLDQCFQQHQAEGRDGIPRDELISYLSDAAEALDYMQQHHDLQHLDIKPENLLLLGRHIKVADFGLVKEVAGRTLNSMVGGMTPTYAAPEIFDNRPCPRTDQYSLAIVYQEMLTGVLPFPGRTAAQLVAQHTQGKPRVAALPKLDQPIVLQALAKDPSVRYPSCSAFIDALAGERQGPKRHWVDPPTPTDGKDLSNDDTQDVSSYQTEPIPRPASPPQHNATEAMPAEALADDSRHSVKDQEKPARSEVANPYRPSPGLAQERPNTGKNDSPIPTIVVSTQVQKLAAPKLPAQPCTLQPALVIGLGGMGSMVLQQLQKHLLRRGNDIPWPELVPMLALDSDQDAMKQLYRQIIDTHAGPLIDTLLIPLRRPQQYKTRSPDLLQWLSRRWLYNIPRSLKTRGYRPLGRLSLVDNARQVLSTLQSHLKRFANAQQLKALSESHALACRDRPPRVVLVGSTSGGTCSGIAIDLAHAIRKVAAARGIEKIEVVGMFVDCSRDGNDTNHLTTANSYAFLTEYETTCQQGNASKEKVPKEMAVFEGKSSPFDHIYFASLEGMESNHPVETWIEQTAEYLAVDLLSTVGHLLDSCRTAAHDNGSGNSHQASQLRSYALAPISVSLEEILQAAQRHLIQQVSQFWQADPSMAVHQNLQGQHLGKASPLSRQSASRGMFRLHASQWSRLRQQLEQTLQVHFPTRASGNFKATLVEYLEERLLDTEFQLTPENEPVLPSCFQSTIETARQHYHDTLQRLLKFSTDASPEVDDDQAEGEKRSRHDLGQVAPEMHDLVARLSHESCRAYLESLEASRDSIPPDLGTILQQTITESLEQLVTDGDPANLITQLTDAVPDIRSAVHGLDASPPQCGHGRHLLVAIPTRWPNRALETEVRQALPDAAIVRAHVPRPMVLYEATGLSLPQVAAKLTEYRPDAIDAARRLYSRNDIQWEPLPQVVSE